MTTLRSQPARLPGWYQPGGDALIAASLAAIMAGGAIAVGGSPIVLRLCAVTAAAGLLALVNRRRWPLRVLAAVFVVVFIEELTVRGGYQVASFLAVMIAAYSLGAHAPRRELALGVALGAAGVAVGHSLGRPTHYSGVYADAFFFLMLVCAPVVVGRLVRARSQLASRVRDATQQLAAARSERVAAALAADRAKLSASVDRALLNGLARMAEHAECATLEQVSALERIARDLLGQLRGLLKELRAAQQPLEPGRPLPDLHARIQRVIEAGAALPTAESADSASPRRWSLASPRLIDVTLAGVAGVVAVGLLFATLGQHALRGPGWGDALLAIAVAAPIAWARRFALPATVVSVAAASAYVVSAAPVDPESGWLPAGVLLVFPLAVGTRCSLPGAAAGLVLCLAAVGWADAVDPAAKFDPASVTPGLALVIGAWAAGRVLRDRSSMLAALANTAVAIEDEREQLAREAVGAEHARVARELHDAVAHAMTVIALQAGAARRVWPTDPELAQQHVRTLRDTVSEVINDLRSMMVALGSGDDTGRVGPERLIERARASGLSVRLEVAGARAPLPPTLEHTVYRILQEGLTNAARHSTGADVLVRLLFGPSGLALEISNGTSSAPAPATNGSGRGLEGMRERVEACGGRLAAGPEPPDRFIVRAWLPWP